MHLRVRSLSLSSSCSRSSWPSLGVLAVREETRLDGGVLTEPLA